MKRDLRIGLVATGFPRFEGDCSGSFLLTAARALVAQGHRVVVLAPEPKRARPAPRWPGIDVRWVPYARPRAAQRAFYGAGAPVNLRADPVAWAGAIGFGAALRVACDRYLDGCDALVSSWCIPSGWVASRAARGRPHLCICHATDVRWLGRMPDGGFVARSIARGATSMWFLSQALRDRFLGIAGLAQSEVTCHVGPMLIDPPIALPCSREELRQSLGLCGTTVLFLGRLVPVKGAAALVQALAGLPEPVAVRIAGDGPERRALSLLADRLGVDATFEGWVFGRRKEALLRACDAIVVPSRPEDGLPTVLFEASARGLPIIATRSNAIVQQRNRLPDAVLVPPSDPTALRTAIADLARRTNRAQGVTRSVPLGGR